MRFLSCPLVLVVTVPWYASPALAGNWGEDWGTMVWGSVAAVPTMGWLAGGLLVGLLAGLGLRRIRRVSTGLGLLLALAYAPVAEAQTVSVPHTLTNGSVAEADTMNENFTAVEVGVNAALTTGSVAVPYTFTNGTTANADEVNANFTELETGVNTALANQADLEEALAACLAPPAPPAGFTFVETNTQGYDEYTHDASGIRFVRLPGGSFDMGSPATETGRLTNEGPVHTVSLNPFLIAKYEVTQAEYAAVMAAPPAGLSATPSYATGDNLPVESVSWDDLHTTDGFLERTGLVLPTEAQWEYACRAGTSGPYGGTGSLDDMGWHDGSSSGGSTNDVGEKQPNQFGLHDMHGNVLEWCADAYDDAFYGKPQALFVDPVATAGWGNRVIRGGSFRRDAQFARSAARLNSDPPNRGRGNGFRPSRPLP